MSLIIKAKEYLKDGLSVIPTKEDKLPALAVNRQHNLDKI